MSGATVRMPLGAARALATELVELLESACERIAGSVRRGRADVGDIELVAIGKRRPQALDLFGEVMGDGASALDERCDALLTAGTPAHRLDKNGRRAYGERYKRLSYRGVALDLFATQSAKENCAIHCYRAGSGRCETDA